MAQIAPRLKLFMRRYAHAMNFILTLKRRRRLTSFPRKRESRV